MVKIFVCGPTIYDYIHLGHARTYLAYDVLIRLLKHEGFKVNFVMNITDVDEKVFERARKAGIDHKSLADKYLHEFEQDLKTLNITDSVKLFKVSDHTHQAEELIKRLMDRGYAYKTKDAVYFLTSKVSSFGELSHLSLKELKMKRLELDPMKHDAMDITLWRRVDEPPNWDFFLGKGRLGWHLQDVAVALTNLGDGYDIHGGAVELIYPHHESLRAIGEALVSDKPFVRFWVHTGLLLRKGEKMSKSKGNTVTVRDAVAEYGADTLRLYILSHHYRRNFNFSLEGLRRTGKKISQLRKSVANFQSTPLSPKTDLNLEKEMKHLAEGSMRRFISAFENDLDTPSAIKAIMRLSSRFTKSNLKNISAEGRANLKKTLRTMLQLLGLKMAEELN